MRTGSRESRISRETVAELDRARSKTEWNHFKKYGRRRTTKDVGRGRHSSTTRPSCARQPWPAWLVCKWAPPPISRRPMAADASSVAVHGSRHVDRVLHIPPGAWPTCVTLFFCLAWVSFIKPSSPSTSGVFQCVKRRVGFPSVCCRARRRLPAFNGHNPKNRPKINQP